MLCAWERENLNLFLAVLLTAINCLPTERERERVEPGFPQKDSNQETLDVLIFQRTTHWFSGPLANSTHGRNLTDVVLKEILLTSERSSNAT